MKRINIRFFIWIKIGGTNISKTSSRDTRTKGSPVNDEIKAEELRVIDANGEQAGIMLFETALSYAERQGFDLVLISPNANPPVAKIMDYGKYRYDQQKREKEAKKRQKTIEIKEIRLSTFIEQHDLEVKGTMAKKFLADGDKLKVSLRFRGRERGKTEIGFEVMQRFTEILKEYGTPEKAPVFEGRTIVMHINPPPQKKEKPAGVAKPKEAETTSPDPADKEKPGTEGAQGIQGKSGADGTQPEPKKKKVKGPSEEMD